MIAAIVNPSSPRRPASDMSAVPVGEADSPPIGKNSLSRVRILRVSPRNGASLLLAWVVSALILAGCALPGNASGSEPPPLPNPSDTPAEGAAILGTAAMRCLFYERELFLSATSSPCRYEGGGRLVAGLIPHHLAASDMIAGFFALAARDQEGFDAILLISPSHFPENCGSDAVTSSAGWETPYGSAAVASDIVAALLRSPLLNAEDNPAAVETDHGAAGLIPFAQYYLPGVPIAACLLSNNLSRDRLAVLQAIITDICADDRVLLIASADCSHYLTPEDASLRDAQTAAAIEALDFERVLGFDDRNVDSPQAVAVLLESARVRNAVPEMLDQSGSVEKLPHALSNPIYRDGITTYFVYAVWS